MERTVLRCTDGGHFKDYEILRDGMTVTVRWGKIGSTKQSKKHNFTSETRARDFANAKRSEKLDKGYSVYTHTVEPTVAPGLFSEDIRLMSQIENGVLA